MINEVYKDIKDYEGLYQISNFGNVKSIKSKKTLVQSSSTSGYKFVNLRKNSKGKNFRVHRLVAQYTLDGRFVREFKSINEAGRETNSSIGTIYKCCVGESKTCNGYKWKFLLESQV